jgi:branched-chain amino acid transport system permease protein
MITPFRNRSAGREAAVMVAVAVVLIALPWFLPLIGGYKELATRIVLWAIFALGFDILLGLTGFLSFGHAAFWGVSAYIAGFTLLHVSSSIIPALVIAVVVTTALSVLIGYLTLRRHGIYFAVLTLAFAEMFYYLALAPLQQWTGGDNGLTGIPTPNLFGIVMQGENVYALVAVFAFIGIYLARRLARSPYGLILRAIKSNETRLSFTGVDVWRYKMMAFVISANYAAVAGALTAIYETYVPTESLHWTTSGEVVMMSVIGGVGTLFGPMVGAAIVLFLENVLSAATEQWLLIQGLIFIGFVIFLPGGVVDGAARLWRLAVRRPTGAKSASLGAPATRES